MHTNKRLEVLRILLRDGQTTIKKIAQELEVTPRTIERHIDALTFSNVPISSKRGRYGGIYIDSKYKIDSSFIGQKDIENIFAALNIFENIFESNVGNDFRQRISLIHPKYIELIQQYFIVDMYEEKLSLDISLEQTLKEALKNKEWILLRNGKRERIMFPLSYVLKLDGLYLYAWQEGYVLIKLNSNMHIELCYHEQKIKYEDMIPYRENKNIKVIQD